jgi:hypothetical protein
MTIDTDYSKRMELLTQLMNLNPHKPIKKLQREALKYYPLHYKESIRMWMGWRVAAQAADILNQQQGIYDD